MAVYHTTLRLALKFGSTKAYQKRMLLTLRTYAIIMHSQLHRQIFCQASKKVRRHSFLTFFYWLNWSKRAIFYCDLRLTMTGYTALEVMPIVNVKPFFFLFQIKNRRKKLWLSDWIQKKLTNQEFQGIQNKLLCGWLWHVPDPQLHSIPYARQTDTSVYRSFLGPSGGNWSGTNCELQQALPLWNAVGWLLGHASISAV